jgi:hypothetical protein
MSSTGQSFSRPIAEEIKEALREILQQASYGEMVTTDLFAEVQVKFPYNINTREVVVTENASGTVSWADQEAKVSSGAATSSSAIMESLNNISYQTGEGGLVRVGARFTAGVAGNQQRVGLGNGTDGLFFGYNGTSFGILRLHNTTETWTAQSSWNVDKMDGTGPSGVTLDPTKGNLFQIRYQWMGYGTIRFYVEHPTTGYFVEVHRIQYANANTVVSIHNPSLPVEVRSANTTNDTAVVVYCAGMAGFIEGRDTNTGPLFSVSNVKTGITTETNILTLRNKTTVWTQPNRTKMHGILLSGATHTTATQTNRIRVIMDATLGGTPVWNDVDVDNSVGEYDTAGTTVSGGVDLGTFHFGASDNMIFPMEDMQIHLPPGHTVTWAGSSTGSAEHAISVTWREET